LARILFLHPIYATIALITFTASGTINLIESLPDSYTDHCSPSCMSHEVKVYEAKDSKIILFGSYYDNAKSFICRMTNTGTITDWKSESFGSKSRITAILEKDTNYIFAGMSAEKLFLGTITTNTFTRNTMNYYISNATNVENVYAFDMGTSFILIASTSSSTKSIIALRINYNGLQESAKLLATTASISFAAMTINSTILIAYQELDKSATLMYINSNLEIIRKTPIGSIVPRSITKHYSKPILAIAGSTVSLVDTKIIYLSFDTCADGYASSSATLICEPCDSSCSTCAAPSNSEKCTSCSAGFTGSSTTQSTFECALIDDSQAMSCIQTFASKAKDTLTISTTFQTDTVKFIGNFNQNLNDCTQMTVQEYIFTSSSGMNLANQYNVTKYSTILNLTSVQILFPVSEITANCPFTESSGTKKYNCIILIGLVSKTTGFLGAGFKIALTVGITYSTISSSSVNFKNTDIYDGSSNVDGTVSIPVTSKLCVDELCTQILTKTVFSQNEEVNVIHMPLVHGTKIISVSKMTALFSNGTSKDAIGYLISQAP